MRYTEFRLDRGDAIFLFGYAEEEGAVEAGGGGGMLVGFDKEGDYRPIISEKTELAERKGGATGAIIACWIGLVMIGIATLLLYRCRLVRALYLHMTEKFDNFILEIIE